MEKMDFVKKWNVAYMSKEEQDELTEEMLDDLDNITASKDQRIADLERTVRQLGENAAKAANEYTQTITDLRRQLSECKAKTRIGVNADRT